MNNSNFDLDEMLGKEVQDVVTSMEGICTGVVTWLFGCKQYSIQPKAKDGSPAPAPESFVIDEGRVKVIGDGIRPKEVKANSGKTGGCHLPCLGRKLQ